MKHNFAKEGETLTADLNYFSGKNTNNSLYLTDYFANGAGSDITNTSQQKVLGGGTNKFLTIQTDYVRPFTGKTKLETGLRFNQQKLASTNDNYFYNDSAKDFLVVPSAATNYRNTNNVYAGYVSFTSAIRDFGYQIGLRGESSSYSGDMLNTKQHYSNKYPLSLFPSVFLSQKLANKQELQLSYTRRVNRPNFFQLIPYTDYTDSLNITRGNPDLKPEFTNSLEMSYLKTYGGNNTFLFSAYYKRTDDLITRYIDTFANELTGGKDLVNTYINANYSRTVGAELTSVTNLFKWWDLTANVNIYNSKINANNITGGSQDPIWSWFGKVNSNWVLPWKIKLQATGIYQSKTNLPVNSNQQQMGPPGLGSAQSSSQGFIRPFWSMDLAASRSFLKGDAATISVSMSDIFRTRWSKQYSESAYFVQDYNRLRDPQLVRVNLSFRFGKMDVSLFKRKSLNNGAAEGASQMQ
jgi:outer membrane receptor protein involved in Fe transport